MDIGVVGPPDSVATVLDEAARAGLPVTCLPLVYTHYTECADLIRKYRSQVGAFLFTGSTPYNYALQVVQPEEAWGVLPRSTDALLCAMVKAVFPGGRDIRRVSADSYDEEDLRRVYAEIGVEEKDTVVLAHPFQVTQPGYTEKLITFHSENVLNGRTDFCLTGIQHVYSRLKEMDVPVVRPFATAEMILQQLQNLYISQLSVARKEHRIAAVSIQIKFSRERSLYGKSDIHFFLCKTRAYNEIYAFAQKIGAAVELHDNEACRIYATEAALEMETKGFTALPVLHTLQKQEGVMFAAAGIGFGEVPADAKYHADFGKDRAFASNKSTFFIVHENHTVVGPIVVSSRKKQDVLVDRGLNRISQRTGIGVERVYQLERAVRVNGLDSATPGELAALCGMSLCNMNRLITKLERNGYARIIGKQPSPRGRPCRLVQILF
ncbi:MAG: hypothetical protein DELT_02417 [Desulfovibrio sp.]